MLKTLVPGSATPHHLRGESISTRATLLLWFALKRIPWIRLTARRVADDPLFDGAAGSACGHRRPTGWRCVGSAAPSVTDSSISYEDET